MAKTLVAQQAVKQMDTKTRLINTFTITPVANIVGSKFMLDAVK